MDNIKKYIIDNNIEISSNLIDRSMLSFIEKKLNLKFGNQLSKYILQYGYIALDYIEFYGINSKQLMESDMIKQTLYLHKYYAFTKPFVALENKGDGDYILIDSNDTIYEFLPSMNNEMICLNQTLFDYIISRFEEVLKL